MLKNKYGILKIRFIKNLIFLVLSAVFLFVSSQIPSKASISKQINYQGKLTNSSSWAVPDDNYDMTFKIYDAASNGNLLWTGTHTTANGNPITVSNGIFSAVLGSGAGNTLNLDFSGSSYYLQVSIYNSGTSSWENFSPRKPMTSVPQAFNANNVIGDGRIDVATTDNSNASLKVTQSGTGDIVNVVDGASEVFTILDGGNVGIGNSVPGARLDLTDTAAGANHIIARFTGAGGNVQIVGNDGSGRTALISSALHGGTSTTGSLNLQSTDGNVNHAKIVVGASSGNDLQFDVVGSSTPVTAMYIKNTSGNVGINTTGPDRKLDVLDSTNPQLRLTQTDGTVYTDLQTTSNGYLSINPSGKNVGIGTSSPNKALHIYEDNAGTGGFRIQNINAGTGAQIQNVLQNDAGNLAYYGITSSGYTSYNIINGGKAFFGSYLTDTVIFTQSAKDIILGTGGTENMRLISGGNLGIGTSGPDRKLDVLDSTNAQLRLTQADGASYTDLQTTSNGYLYMAPSGSRIGILNSNPSYTLDVTGTINASTSLKVGGYDVPSSYANLSENLVQNPRFLDGMRDWYLGNSALWTTPTVSDAIPSDWTNITSTKVARVTQVNATDSVAAYSQEIPLDVTQTYYVEVWARRVNSGDGKFYMGVKLNTSDNGGHGRYFVSNNNLTTDWTKYTTTIGPNGAQGWGISSGHSQEASTFRFEMLGPYSPTTPTTLEIGQVVITPISNRSQIAALGTGNNYFAGNVGINTASPARKLDITDTANPQLRLTYTNSSVYTDLQTNSSGYLNIAASGSRVGIGNASPASALDVTGTITSTGLTVSSGTVSLPNDQINPSEIAQGTAGQILMSNATPDTAWVTPSGDVTIDSSGITTIGTDKVALTTDTTGNYVQSITNGSGISGANGGSEGAALTLALGPLTADWNQSGAYDLVLGNASSELKIMESTGATYYGTLDVGDLSADATYTFSGASGTVWTSGNDGTGSTLDADLLDGHDTSYFMASGTDNWVNTTGDTMTGALTLSGVTTDITSGTNEDIVISPNGTGKVGVGTTSPTEKLTIQGNLQLNGTAKINMLDWNSIVSVFGQRQSKINELTDVLYQADKRFTVTNGSYTFFDGNYDSSIALPSNTTTVMNINMASQSGIPANGITYPQGSLYVSFYHIYNNYVSMSLRVKANGTWYDAGSPTNISTAGTYKVMQFGIPANNYLTDFELTIVTDGTNQVNLAEVNYVADRWTTELELPYVSKYLTSNYVFGNFGVKTNAGAINNLLSGTSNSYLASSTGSLGVGTTGPDRKLDVLDASNPQLRLTQADGTVYTDLQTNSSGYLNINASGNRIGVENSSPGYTLDVGGDTNISDSSEYRIGGTQVLSKGNGSLTGNLIVGDGGGSLTHGSGNEGYYDTAVGIGALNANTTGSSNTALGTYALVGNTTGSQNVGLGVNSGSFNQAGNYNVMLGSGAGYGVTGNSYSGNTFVGYQSGFSATTGGSNFFGGLQAGYSNATGAGNIFLGYQAGYNETGSNKLYVDNSNTTTPLLYGDFSTDTLTINGTLKATGETIGTMGSGYAQFRAISGDYGFMIRNDGAASYLLLTNSGDQYGSWNSFRPIAINNSTGGVTIANTTLSVSTGGVQVNSQISLRLADSDSSNYVGFQAPATLSGNTLYTLPSADGSNNQVLTTNGSGTLSWTTPSGGGSGTVTNVATGNGLTGGPITTTGTISLGNLTGDWTQAGAYDIVLANASSELKIMESTGGTYYGIFDVGDLSADATYTFSGASGTVLTSANYSTTLDPIYVNVSGDTMTGNLTFSGAQTIYGGTAANDDLTILGTSNATRTSSYLILQPSGGTVGIGTTTPTNSLSVKNTGAAQGLFYGYSVVGNRVNDDSGTILLGNNTSWQGRFDYSATGGTTFNIDNTYDSASAVTQFRFRTAGTTTVNALTLLGSGNMGLSTTTPDRRLEVLDGSNPQLRLTNTDGSVYTDFNTNSSGYLSIVPTQWRTGIDTTTPDRALDIYDYTGPQLRLTYTDNSVYTDIQTTGNGELYINPSGKNVGIGINDPTNSLTVRDAAAAQALFYGYSVDGTLASDSNGSFNLGSNANYQGRLDYNGSAGYTTFNIDNTYNHDSSVIQFRLKTSGTPVTAMTLLGSGNVGVNTTGADRKLDVLDASNPQLRLTQADASKYVDLQADSSSNLIITPNGGDIVLSNAATEIKIMESAGNTYYGILEVGDLSADATYTFSGATGTVLTSANYSSSLDSAYVNVGGDSMTGSLTFSGVTTDITTGTNESLAIMPNGTGNVGVNTSGPDRKLDVLDASNPQLRLTYTDGSVYTDFQTTSSGYLYLNPSGGRIGIANASPSYTLDTTGTFRVTGNTYLANTNGTVSVGPQDNANEGAELDMYGSSTYDMFRFDNYAGYSRIYWSDSNNHVFQVFNAGTGVSDMYLEGKLGVGTNPATYQLNVAGTGYFSSTLTMNDDILLANASAELKVMESAGNTYYGTIDIGDLNADATYTLTGPSGNIITSTSEAVFTGAGRHTRKSQLNAEYPGAVLTKFYGAGTDTITTGTMTSDTDTSTGLLRTFYNWLVSDSSLNYYTVAVRFTLPSDFDSWATSDALQIDFLTNTTTATDNAMDVYVYNSDDTPGTAVASSTGNKSDVANTWKTLSLAGSSLYNASSPDWNTAGHTGVIYLRMSAKNNNFVKISDIKLNYLSKW